MRVDLQEIRRRIEEELRDLERREVALKEQLSHIESVVRLASGFSIAGKDGESLAPGSDDDKSWFRR